MFAIIGSLVVLGSVLGGFAMGGSSLLLLWHPLEIVVICGAALGAFLISNPLKVDQGLVLRARWAWSRARATAAQNTSSCSSSCTTSS